MHYLFVACIVLHNIFVILPCAMKVRKQKTNGYYRIHVGVEQRRQVYRGEDEWLYRHAEEDDGGEKPYAGICPPH